MTLLKKCFLAMAAGVMTLSASIAMASGPSAPLDRAPERTNNLAALQNGAKLFVNYCLNCHSAANMRYTQLRELGLTDVQIKENLILANDKIGDMMKTTLSEKDAKAWFGAMPPDLSVIARSKASGEGSGADWIYTYMRTFYKDDTRATGWNNLVFPNVGMPHVMWEMQGVRTAKFETVKEHGKDVHKFVGFETVSPGTMTAAEYDNMVGDLVAYLQWMGEPAQNQRKRIGVWVVLLMALLATFAWRLNASYWKDLKS